MLLEFIPNIFVALTFDFMLYITGASILRVVTFGLLKYQLHSYSEFKKKRGNSKTSYFIPYIIGMFFYALIIGSIAWLN
jgi:hypothetical protein